MIGMLVLTATMPLPDLDAVRASVGKCERPAVSKVFAQEPQRRASFLVDAAREQQEIASMRQALADRRRMLRAGSGGSDTPDAIAAVALDLDDRQQALNDRRAVDAAYREALDFLRQHYVSSCAQGSGHALNR